MQKKYKKIYLEEKHEEVNLDKKIKIIILGGILLFIGIYLEFFTEYKILAQIILLITVAITGHEIIKKGILGILKGFLNINFLMTIAAAGAFLIGHGEEGAAIVYLFFIAEFFESYATNKARRSVEMLLKLFPETVIVKNKGKEISIKVNEVKTGDIIVVKPGDRIPLDGIVIKGFSYVNQAQITGESNPVFKKEGDNVFAGSLNKEGYLEIKVTKRLHESTLSKIIKLIEKAQKEKSSTEAFIDKFAKFYTPLIIIFAILIATIPTLIFNLPFEEWIYKSLILLVIACPCALVISTPVSMVSAINSAAKNGTIIKGGKYIEEIKNEKVIVFDKTGTLTEGKFIVTDIISFDNYSKEKILKIAFSLEKKSSHPISEAIIKIAEENNIKEFEVKNFKSFPGKGVFGIINDEKYFIGNKYFLKELNVNFPEKIVENFENKGKTVIIIAKNRDAIGLIILMDKIREEAFSTISMLKNRGLKIVMLTGDNDKVAKSIAEKLKINEHYAELFPEDKVKVIERLLKKYNHVTMVGDGINDAAALTRAHVGIAMGSIGSDIAIESSDIILMKDELSKIIYLIKLSEKTMKIIKQNIFASIIIKSSFVFLTFPGLITLWLAVAIGDMGLSLAVILNAFRISKVKA